MESIKDDFDGKVVIGNLNYDTLLLAAILDVLGDRKDLSDLCSFDWKPFGNNSKNSKSAPLRREYNYKEENRFSLMHLHGSLTYWSTDDDECYKLNRRSLEEYELLKQWRVENFQEKPRFKPLVILADSRFKKDQIKKYPFSLAYKVVGEAAKDSENWLIVGYSFRDKSVNDMLKESLSERCNNKLKTKILVVDINKKSSDFENDILKYHASNFPNVYIERFSKGIENIIGSRHWKWFTGDEFSFKSDE